MLDFGSPHEESRARDHGSRRAFFAALLLVAVVLFFRRPDAFLRPQFRAEDGALFFKDNLLDGVTAFAQQYAGYLHLPARLGAFIAGIFPWRIQPALYSLFSLGYTLLVVAKLFSARVLLPGKVLMAAAMVLVPASTDVFLSLSNVQWITALLLVLLAIQESAERWSEWIGDLAILIFAGLGGPFVAIFLPLFVLRLMRRGRSAYSCVLLTGAAILAGVQVYCAIIEGRATGQRFEFSSAQWMEFAVRRPVTATFAGDQIGQRVGPIFALVILVAVAGISFAFAVRDPKTFKVVIPLLLAAGGVWLSLSFRIFSTPPQFMSFLGGGRYFYVPRVLLAWSLIATLRLPWARTGSAALLLLMLLSSGTSFQLPQMTDYSWRSESRKLRSGQAVQIPINPEGWMIDLPSRKP